ncbi:MAG: TetR/AcrR family transcriptional regulator [Campylobacter sp.]|nr:TetR/AcrR family transcriptional regulator [Campylobacter sp.]
MKFDPANKRAYERYNRILEAGFDLFLEKGYKDTSLSEIVERAGGSLSTIYKYFENKEGLFRDIILSGIDKLNTRLKREININENLSLEEFLYKFGLLYFDIILDDRTIVFFRLVLSESFNKDTYKTGQIFMKDIDSFMDECLINFFINDPKMREFSSEELKNHAALFTYLVREPFFQKKLLFGIKTSLEKEDREVHLRKIINIFLYGIFK